MNRMCRRCGYDWQQRGATVPRQCPFCKSPKWNIERAAKPAVDRLAEAGAKIAAARGPIALTTAAALETERRHWEPVED